MPLLNDDARPFLDAADAPDEQLARRELGLERRATVGGQRDQESTSSLRVVAERLERLRELVCPDVASREIPVARIAARADALPRKVERTVDCRETLGFEPDANAAPIRHLVRVAEQSEAGDVRNGIRLERPQRLGGLLVE